MQLKLKKKLKTIHIVCHSVRLLMKSCLAQISVLENNWEYIHLCHTKTAHDLLVHVNVFSSVLCLRWSSSSFFQIKLCSLNLY